MLVFEDEHIYSKKPKNCLIAYFNWQNAAWHSNRMKQGSINRS